MFNWIKNFFNKDSHEINASNMNLEAFVSESIVQIFNGVRDAQNKIAKTPISKEDEKHFRGYIMPSPTGGRKNDIDNIKFDVAVTISNKVSNTSQANINTDIYVVKGNIKSEDSTNDSNSSVTRMQFSIPVIYPSMPFPHTGNE